MADPIAYFITWTCYGTWLPGDERGWVDAKQPGILSADPARRSKSQILMTEDPCVLSQHQRQVVEQTIAKHCEIRSWELRALNVRTNHVHVVVSANATAETVMEQLKAWCTRKLKEQQRVFSER